LSLGISVLFLCLIAPLLILIRLDGFDYPAAAAIAGTLLAASLLLLALFNVSQTWLQARLRTEG
jgi:sulfate/thiosulfate transport system permease protein